MKKDENETTELKRVHEKTLEEREREMRERHVRDDEICHKIGHIALCYGLPIMIAAVLIYLIIMW